jgi:hypothetical protein
VRGNDPFTPKVDSFPEIAVARFLGIVARGKENNTCKKDEREYTHKKHPPEY